MLDLIQMTTQKETSYSIVILFTFNVFEIYVWWFSQPEIQLYRQNHNNKSKNFGEPYYQ